MPHVRPPDPIVEVQTASALHLAGEAFTSDVGTETVTYAMPQADGSVPLLEDYDWLRDLAAYIRQVIAEDPRRAELLRRLPQALGKGEVLPILFGNLFPEQRHQRKETRAGKRELTETQIEVLRGIAVGHTPAQIAVQRSCTATNIHSILKTIEDRLDTSSPQESIAVAISKGYLPLDVMDYVRDTAQCEPRDYEPLAWQISAHGLENIENAAAWQELAAFGLFLMLTTNTVSAPLQYAANPPAPTGVLYCLEPRRNGSYRARQIVGAGRLRHPSGLAIAPLAAERQGFTPGHIYIVSYLAIHAGLNIQEIVAYSPDGK